MARDRLTSGLYHLAVITLIISLSNASISTALLSESASMKSPAIDTNWRVLEEGGRSLLVEELTATWCDACAEIDPYLREVQDSHGSRIAMVAYHPADGEDAFQPAAAQHRIERLRETFPNIGATPVFTVEQFDLHEGSNAWPDVASDILRMESNRQNYSEITIQGRPEDLTFQINTSSTNLENTQITVLVSEYEKVVPAGATNPGGETRDRVVTGILTFDPTNLNISIQEQITIISEDPLRFKINPETQFYALTAIHEPTIEAIQNGSSPSTFGVVEYSHYPVHSSDSSYNDLLSVMFVGLLFLPVIPRATRFVKGLL